VAKLDVDRRQIRKQECRRQDQNVEKKLGRTPKEPKIVSCLIVCAEIAIHAELTQIADRGETKMPC
jgi:hypothetical protein